MARIKRAVIVQPVRMKRHVPVCTMEAGKCRMFCTYVIGRREICLGYPLENCPNNLVWLAVDGEEVGKISVRDVGPWMAAFIKSLKSSELEKTYIPSTNSFWD